MSQENINLVKKFYHAAPRRDFETARTVFDPNIEWILPNLGNLFGGTYRGADAVFRDVIQPALAKFDNFHADMTHFFDVGDHVIAIGTFHGRSKQTGKELNAPTAVVWTFRDGKAVRYQAYHDAAKWAEALGLAQPEGQRMAA